MKSWAITILCCWVVILLSFVSITEMAFKEHQKAVNAAQKPTPKCPTN